MTLRIISEDYNSSFSDLVAMLNEKTIHQMCIDFLMTKAFKCLNGLSQNLINVSFQVKIKLSQPQKFQPIQHFHFKN